MSGSLWLSLRSVAAVRAASGVRGRRADRRLASRGRRNTLEMLRAANMAGASLRAGWTTESIQAAILPLGALAGTGGLLIAGPAGSVASQGLDEAHQTLLLGPVAACMNSGRPLLLGQDQLECGAAGCALSSGVIAPVHVRGAVVGALATIDPAGSRALVELCAELARYVSTQLEVGDAPGAGARSTDGGSSLEVLSVDGPGRTLFVSRRDVVWVESAGDYVRIHTSDRRSLLARYSLGRLEEAWTAEGFARIHRQYLVSLGAIRELRRDGPHTSVALPDTELPVSRRHTRDLRDRLVRHAGRDRWPTSA